MGVLPLLPRWDQPCVSPAGYASLPEGAAGTVQDRKMDADALTLSPGQGHTTCILPGQPALQPCYLTVTKQILTNRISGFLKFLQISHRLKI